MDRKNESALPLAGINIARISTVPTFVITQLKCQIESIAMAGATVTVISSAGPEQQKIECIPGVRYVVIEIARSISLLSDICALVRLFVILKREHVQIAHSTTPKAGLITALAGYFAGVPLRLHTFTGQPWLHMHSLKGWFARVSDKLIGRLNTCCYADSKSQMKFLLNQGIIKKEKLYVIGPGSLAGVDVCRFSPERFTSYDNKALRESLGISTYDPVLVFVGRITPDKGIRELINAFKIIKETIKNTHLILVGDFDADSGVEGKITIDEINPVKGIHSIGYTDLPERYLSIANVLCLPSYREGFGTIVIEAAAMGLPAIGSDIYGLRDAVVHGETGLLIPPKNSELLVDAILTLLLNHELRTKLGKAAIERARTLFSAETINQCVVAEYVRLLHDNKLL